MIRIGNQRHDVAAVVFDKDGTLVHFGELWSSIMQRWTEAVLPEDAPMTVRQQLHDALGVTADGRLIPNGVAHSGTLEQMRTTTADVLSRHDPESAQEVVQGSADILETFEDHEIVPIGDVTGALRALSRAGIGVAVATSDDRSPAERQLEHLGIADIVDVMVCGDDEIAPKPSPRVMTHISEALAVPARRMAMVGDSAVDMATGRSAGAAICVGVTEGGGDPVGADVLIRTVEEVEPVDE